MPQAARAGESRFPVEFLGDRRSRLSGGNVPRACRHDLQSVRGGAGPVLPALLGRDRAGRPVRHASAFRRLACARRRRVTLPSRPAGPVIRQPQRSLETGSAPAGIRPGGDRRRIVARARIVREGRLRRDGPAERQSRRRLTPYPIGMCHIEREQSMKNCYFLLLIRTRADLLCGASGSAPSACRMAWRDLGSAP